MENFPQLETGAERLWKIYHNLSTLVSPPTAVLTLCNEVNRNNVTVDQIVSPPTAVLTLCNRKGSGKFTGTYRRHLTPSQKAMVAARARKAYDAQAKERQKSHGNTAPGKAKTLPANLPEVNDTGDARDKAGKAVGVSGKSGLWKIYHNRFRDVWNSPHLPRQKIRTSN